MKNFISILLSLSLALIFAISTFALMGENYALFDEMSDVTIPKNEHLAGDANGDGYVNLLDAVAILRYSVGNCKNTLRDGVDANCDGTVNTMDVLLSIRHVVGNDVGLDVVVNADGSAKEEALTEESIPAFEITVKRDVSNGDLSVLDVNGGLFLGWYKNEDAAKVLDATNAAENDFVGDVYGAFLALDFEIAGVDMFAVAPYGIRFVSKINENALVAIETVNAANRFGKNATFTPANEWKTGVGFGTALAIDVEVDGSAEKADGSAVCDKMTVPAVYFYGREDGTVSFTATVIGVTTAQMADKIAARPYITYIDANGNERTVYANGDSESFYNVLLATVNGDNTEEEKAAANACLAQYFDIGEQSVSGIALFNLSSEEGSADNDNAYIELDKTTLVALTEDDHSRYRNAFYPRITRVCEDLYLMTFNYSQNGQHIYFTTSVDGVNWEKPGVLYGSTSHKFTYEFGSLMGTTDMYYGATADHLVLDDGRIMCVYSRRPCKGYSMAEYASINSIDMVIGTVENGKITWSEPTAIYYGQNWEPEIIKRSNGDIEVYWSHAAPMIQKYGFHEERRSSGVAMISSSDGGNTWTPNVTADDTNLYAGKRIYQYSAGKFTVNSGEVVNFYHGQMPGVVELVDGRMMVVGETRPISRSYHMISMARSNADGTWTELGIDEAGPTDVVEDMFDGAGPTLMRFDSGELLLTYNDDSALFARVLDKTGSNALSAFAYNAFGTDLKADGGFWSASAPVDSHTAILSMSYKKYNGRVPVIVENEDGTQTTTLHNTTLVGKVRLNHTLDAVNKNMVADGNIWEWDNITDALFVGSDSAVQATYRFAYDNEYIYVAIDRTDDTLNADDSAYISVATENGYVTAEIGGIGVLQSGVFGASKAAEGGTLYELCFDRAALGLMGDSIRVFPGFTDADMGVNDTVDGTDVENTSTWIKINLK